MSRANSVLSYCAVLTVCWQTYVQFDRECGALSNPAIDTDGALMFLDYAVHDGKPQPRSLSKKFGCEEWAEYLVDVLWGYAKAGVLNLYDYRLSVW